MEPEVIQTIPPYDPVLGRTNNVLEYTAIQIHHAGKRLAGVFNVWDKRTPDRKSEVAVYGDTVMDVVAKVKRCLQ